MLNVDELGFTVFKECSVCKTHRPKRDYSQTQWKKLSKERACHLCLCSYCHAKGKTTREHYLPKSYGGRYIIRVCYLCNQARGNSFDWEKFQQHTKRNPSDWVQALSTGDPKRDDEVVECILNSDIARTTVKALIQKSRFFNR